VKLIKKKRLYDLELSFKQRKPEYTGLRSRAKSFLNRATDWEGHRSISYMDLIIFRNSARYPYRSKFGTGSCGIFCQTLWLSLEKAVFVGSPHAVASLRPATATSVVLIGAPR
jgi:hypothetical protein